jgi:perosamine synthetase
MAQNLLIQGQATLHDAMRLINLNGSGIVFVVDDCDRLIGALTDGDIRRALLAKRTLESAVTTAMTRNCASLSVHAKREDVLRFLTRNQSIRLLPLVNAQQKPVDFASLQSLHRIPVANPDLGGNEIEYVTSCLRDGWISSQGPFVRRFEEEFANYVGVEDAVATSSGTTALHLAIEGLGIGPGDEVLVPDLTFAASINAILYAGASPVLVDVDPDTWNLDPTLLERELTSRTRAVMVVHLYGHAADMSAIQAFCAKNGLFLIEDAAEALGAQYGNSKLGAVGDVAAFSFFGNKLITTGEGGMVVARSPDVINRMRILRDHGMNPAKRYWHDVVGYNYRMTNIQAALGVAQLERIDEFVSKKKHIGKTYRELLSDLEWIYPQASVAGANDVCWLFSIRLSNRNSTVARDALIKKLSESGVDSRPVFFPLHRMPPYQRFVRERTFVHSDLISNQGLSLPSAISISDGEIEYVCGLIRQC